MRSWCIYGIRPASLAPFVLAPIAAVAAIPAAHADPAKASDSLEEIIVTAEKRESTVQKTTFSLTAITGAELQAEGLSTIRDVAAEVPGISMRYSGPGQTEWEMRGLPSSGGSSSTVGLYLNDTPLSAPAAALNGKVTIDPDLFDLSRVEVLRGPQGTLYGSSSMGGTIKLITNPANLNKFESAFQTVESGTEHGGFNWGGSAMVNLPIKDDRLAVRLVGTYKFTDGWIDRDVVSPFPAGSAGDCGFAVCTRGNLLTAPVVQKVTDSNWERLAAGRAAVRFQATDELSIDALLMYQQLSTGGPPDADVPPGADYLTHYQPLDINEPYSDTFRLYSLNVNYDFGDAALTSATSYWSRTSSWSGDFSEMSQNLNTTYYGFTDLVPDVYLNTDTSHQTTEELRLASTGNRPWQWIVGAYFADFESVFSQYTGNPAFAVLSVGGPEGNPQGIAYQAYNPYHIKQYALFAESSYLFSNGLKTTLGLRGYKYDTQLSFEQSGIFTQTGNAGSYGGEVSGSDKGVNPKINIGYLVNPDLTLYTQAAKGFRPGGVNLPLPPLFCPTGAPLSYGPDSLWDYEIGEKGRFFDGRLTVNADYYYIVWNDVQQIFTASCGYPYTANAGKAVSRGPELELSAQITPNFSLGFNGSYTDAYIKDVYGSGGLLGFATPLTPGLALQNVPRYSATATANYSHPITDTYSFKGRLTATRTGPSHDVNFYFQQLPAYTISGARVGVVGGPMSVFLFVDNLTNSHAIVSINTTQFSGPDPALTRAAVTMPRTAGVDFQYKF